MFVRFLVKLSLLPMLFMFNVSFAGGQFLSEITMPNDVENIHVVKLASDAHSTDFVVFVKNKVPAHKHLQHSETVYVIEGRGIFTMDGKSMDIGPDHYIKIPQGAVHSVVTTSKIPLKVLSVQAPEFFGKDRVMVTEP